MKQRLREPLAVLAGLAFLLPSRFLSGPGELLLAGAAAGAGAVALWTRPFAWETRAPARRAAWVFAWLQGLYIFSFLYAVAFLGASPGVPEWLELPRWLLLGVFCVHLLRRGGEGAAAAAATPMVAALYASWIVFEDPRVRGYVAVLTMCALFFASRSRFVLLHAATALVVVLFADRAAWAGAAFVLSAALASRLHERLARKRRRTALHWSLAAFAFGLWVSAAALWAAPAPATRESAPVARTMRALRQSPALGWGPASPETSFPGGGQYLRWLLKGGALGGVVILTGLVLCGRGLLRAGRGDAARRTGAAAFLGAAALMLATGAYLESYRLCMVTALLAATMTAPVKEHA